ncbi:MAG: bifunctional diguanylate cyclase/phosphodiesterase [Burkholderiales bacterium]
MATLSIRNHLLLLVSALSTPLIAFVWVEIYFDMKRSVAEANALLRTKAAMMVLSTRDTIANGRNFLEHLAVLPSVLQLDPNHCGTVLADLPRLNPDFANVGTTDTEGQVVCSAVPLPGGASVNLGQTPWFQRFAKEKRFTVGEPFFGPITGKWVSVLSVPIRNERQEMIGGVHLPLDLHAFDPRLPANLLPANSRYGLLSVEGVLIWRNSDSEGAIGTWPQTAAMSAAIKMRDGDFEDAGADGVLRLYSVASTPEIGWIAFIGAPASSIYAATKQSAMIASAFALSVIGVLFLIAFFIARRIIEPIAALERAARALHAGDLGVRAVTDGPSEIAAVSQEFNAMIDSQQRAVDELRIAAIAFESQESMFVTDANANILRVNKAFTQSTGYSAEEVVGQTPRLLSSGRHDSAFYERLWDSVKRTGSWQGEIWDRRKNGEIFPKLLTITAVMSEAGAVTHYVGTHIDITDIKRAQDEIRHLAFYDHLTQLPNRRLLLDRLQQALASSARSGRRGAALLIDLDDFKTLNDTLGHDKGDLLLQQVGQRLSTCVREDDTVARLGGDEFVVLLEGLSESTGEAATQTESVGEKVLAALNAPYFLDGIERHSTPSVGVTLFSGHQVAIDELLKQANLAMYQAKAAGRNTLRFFDPTMQSIVADRAVLAADLREALSQQQLVLYYQPQVIGDRRLTGAEALVRWRHPRRGMVSPAEFIPLAEETGLILALGQWVLQTACIQLARWASQPGTADLLLAVNVSAKQLQQADFVDQVLEVLASTGANPNRLKLELTESLLVSNVEISIAKMTALKAHGVGFSLDDFGTGYSSLFHLKRLPLDQLKIDQSFVRDILINPNDAAIAKMIIALAESLGLSVIAEGVELEAQREFLARHGCHAYQGYLFSRPLPLGEFEELMVPL